MNFDEFYLQSFYQFRHNIGYLASVKQSEEIATAQVDTSYNVEIGKYFYETYIKKHEDMAFILGHESAHKNVNIILASDFELNWRYSVLILKGYTDNFLSDLFINQMLFHAIPSTVSERYYATSTPPILKILQRSIKVLKELPTTSDKSELKLKMFLLACRRWYVSDETPLLYDVFKTACDYLLELPSPEQQDSPTKMDDDGLMVQHKEEAEPSEAKEIEIEKQESAKGDLKDANYTLRIPQVLSLDDSFRLDPETYQKMKSFNDLIESQIAKIEIYFGDKRIPGYADPEPEELVMWSVEQYIPWTEPVQAQPVQQVVLFFDVSGSMFQCLALLFKVKAMLAQYETKYYAFSTFVTNIAFHKDHAEVLTGLGTNLDCILDKLEELEPAVIYLTTDGEWSLSKRWMPEGIERVFRKHKVTIFQKGISKLNHIPLELVNVVPLEVAI